VQVFTPSRPFVARRSSIAVAKRPLRQRQTFDSPRPFSQTTAKQRFLYGFASRNPARYLVPTTAKTRHPLDSSAARAWRPASSTKRAPPK